VETAAIGRMFTAKHGGRLDANREFLGLAVANLASGLGRGFAVSGGMSQSLVNEGGGARTPLSGAFAAGIVLIVVLFLSHLLSGLPQPVLAAMVLVAVAGLIKVSTASPRWRTRRSISAGWMSRPPRRAAHKSDGCPAARVRAQCVPPVGKAYDFKPTRIGTRTASDSCRRADSRRHPRGVVPPR
jgi:hypothetical protein